MIRYRLVTTLLTMALVASLPFLEGSAAAAVCQDTVESFDVREVTAESATACTQLTSVTQPIGQPGERRSPSCPT